MNKPKSEFIVCIDSDGCAMDTMNFKHFDFFGPLAVKQWGIKNPKAFLEIWNEVNLFSETRGCNRFIALYLVFKKYSNLYHDVKPLNEVENWTKNAKQLSNNSLEELIKQTNSNELKNALEWSLAVNKAVKENKHESKPFDGVKDAFEAIYQVADIACVSSANKEAVHNEWDKSKLLHLCRFVFTQEDGSKKACIKKLLDEYQYSNKKIVMIGDSPGDLDAAKTNNVYFYPILFNKEKTSWDEFKNIYLQKFVNNSYADFEEGLIAKFNQNLKEGV